jgi:Uma2 family endonuclease
MSKPEKHIYTADEYLAHEGTAETRSEFFNGELFAMVGASINHNRIVTNLVTWLTNQFLSNNTSCEAVSNDMRVELAPQISYAYPDVVVICEQPEFVEGRNDTLINPAVIFEVLSESTRDYDRGSKFAAYRKISTLKDYITVEQGQVGMEHFSRIDDTNWSFSVYEDDDQELKIASIRATIPVGAVYRRVVF